MKNGSSIYDSSKWTVPFHDFSIPLATPEEGIQATRAATFMLSGITTVVESVGNVVGSVGSAVGNLNEKIGDAIRMPSLKKRSESDESK